MARSGRLELPTKSLEGRPFAVAVVRISLRDAAIGASRGGVNVAIKRMCLHLMGINGVAEWPDKRPSM